MITGIITFLVIFAVIGSILYGQRLVKTEKSDAVFGNPERAKGGVHWVIVGSSFLLLSVRLLFVRSSDTFFYRNVERKFCVFTGPAEAHRAARLRAGVRRPPPCRRGGATSASGAHPVRRSGRAAGRRGQL